MTEGTVPLHWPRELVPGLPVVSQRTLRRDVSHPLARSGPQERSEKPIS